MKDREFFLHIGTHKTGTTSFQKFLESNFTALTKQDVFPFFEFTAKGTRRFNAVRLAHLFIRNELATGARLRGNIPRWGHQAIGKHESVAISQINQAPQRTVIASAEGFSFLRTSAEQDKIRRFLAQIDRNVTIFVVFRNDMDWRESWNNQLAKDRAVQESIGNYSPQDRPDGEWYFNKDTIRSFWFELASVVELRYEDHNDICSALVSEMHVNPAGMKSVSRQNTRVDV